MKVLMAELRALVAEMRVLVAKQELAVETPKPSPAPTAKVVPIRTERRLYSVKEVAELLSLDKDTVYQLAYSGRIKTVKIGRRRLVPSEALDDYVAGRSESS